MTRAEFLAWIEFFKLHPFDDANRYHRPAAIVAHSMAGADIGELLAWLTHEKPVEEGYSEADMNTFKAFGVKPPTAAERAQKEKE